MNSIKIEMFSWTCRGLLSPHQVMDAKEIQIQKCRFKSKYRYTQMPSFTVFTLHTYLVMDASRKELKETQIFMHFDPSFARCVHIKADVRTSLN